MYVYKLYLIKTKQKLLNQLCILLNLKYKRNLPRWQITTLNSARESTKKQKLKQHKNKRKTTSRISAVNCAWSDRPTTQQYWHFSKRPVCTFFPKGFDTLLRCIPLTFKSWRATVASRRSLVINADRTVRARVKN